MRVFAKTFFFIITGLALLTFGCSSTGTYTAYQHDINNGKQFLKQGEYTEAKTEFLKAAGRDKRPEALALAATASYKANDLPAAAEYLSAAESAGKPGFSYFRIAGYKSLLLLKEGKKEEGMKNLGEYIVAYRKTFDSDTLPDLEFMWKRGNVDQTRLERLIDKQVGEYESSMEWLDKTGTGSPKQSYR